MGGLKHGHGVGQIGAGGNANTTHLRSQSVRHIVAIEVEGGNHAVLGGAQQNLLQKGVGNHVFNDDVFAGFGIFNLAPWAAVNQLSAKLFHGQVVAPITEATFGELHDVALVHQGQAGLVVVNGVFNGLAHQTLGSFNRHGLDTNG